MTQQEPPAPDHDDTVADPVENSAGFTAGQEVPELAEATPVAGPDTDAGVGAVAEPASTSEAPARPDADPPIPRLLHRLPRRTRILAAAAGVLVIVTVAVIAIVASQSPQTAHTSQPSQTALPGSYLPWIQLPFNGDLYPVGVAVDTAGNVYVIDGAIEGKKRVLKLAAGATTPTQLPLTGLGDPTGVAVDTAGSVYVATEDRVFKLAAGATTPTELPFTTLRYSTLRYSTPSVAVDTAGNVYVVTARFQWPPNVNEDPYWNGDLGWLVAKLAAGATTPTEMRFNDVGENPCGLAVDTAGNVYLVDGQTDQVQKLPAGATTPTQLPFTGLQMINGVAVDTAGNVYVTDVGRLLKLAARATTPTELFPGRGGRDRRGIGGTMGVAVDTAGNVYVAVYGFGIGRVLKLPAQ